MHSTSPQITSISVSLLVRPCVNESNLMKVAILRSSALPFHCSQSGLKTVLFGYGAKSPLPDFSPRIKDWVWCHKELLVF